MIKLTDILAEFFGPFKKKSQSSSQPVKRKAGEVWKTSNGKYGSINRVNPNYVRYFDTEEKARAYATAKIKKAKQPEQPIKPTNPNSLPQKALSAEKERRKAMFNKFKDKLDIKDDEEAIQILRQLQQMQRDEPSKKDDEEDFKFGGGGGFSGGGSSGRF